jgi:hypothetical protein
MLLLLLLLLRWGLHWQRCCARGDPSAGNSTTSTGATPRSCSCHCRCALLLALLGRDQGLLLLVDRDHVAALGAEGAEGVVDGLRVGRQELPQKLLHDGRRGPHEEGDERGDPGHPHPLRQLLPVLL